MKLLVSTQYRENYAAHDWNGEGTCPQYWKFKGGETYVVRNLSESHVVKIQMDGIPTLTNLIEYSNEFEEEYVLEYMVVEDDEYRNLDSDIPILLHYSKERDLWMATRTIKNEGEFRVMSKSILSKTDQWIMGEAGERLGNVTTYLMEDGNIIYANALEQWYANH